MDKKCKTAKADKEEVLAAAGKINPNVDDVSVFDESGTSKKVVTQKKAKTLPTSIYKNGSGTFVSVMLFQIIMSDL